MSTFLFAGHPAAGHLNPLLSIGGRLRDDGHTVIFSSYGPGRMAAIVETEGFRFIPVRPAPSSVCLLVLPLLSGYAETFFALNSLLSSLGYYARRYERLLDELEPDVVVSEMTFQGPLLAAEKRGVPHVLVCVAGLSLPGPGIPPFGSGLPIGTPEADWPWWLPHASRFLANHVDARIRRVRARLKLPEGEDDYLARMPAKWLNLMLTAEAIEAPRHAPHPHTFFVGPCFAGRRASGEADFLFERLASNKPKVFVSLGTVFNRKPSVFRRIIQAQGDGKYQVIVSAGRSFHKLKSLPLPEHVLLFDSVPQIELLKHVDVVVSHGGNNTVNETLAAGKPLLVMPVGGEQGDNASRVVYLGTGLRANIKHSGPAEIAEKVDRLVQDPSFKQRAHTIARELAMTDGVRTAARFITRLAKVRQPLRRPEGYPLTVRLDTPMPWEWPENRSD